MTVLWKVVNSMIVKALLDLVYLLFDLWSLPIDLPSMPENVSQILSSTLEYVKTGLALLANWTDLGYLLILFGVVVLVDAGVHIYNFVMWVLRKIPALGIN